MPPLPWLSQGPFFSCLSWENWRELTAGLAAQLSQGFPATTGEAAKAKRFVHSLLTVPAPAHGKDKHLVLTLDPGSVTPLYWRCRDQLRFGAGS